MNDNDDNNNTEIGNDDSYPKGATTEVKLGSRFSEHGNGHGNEHTIPNIGTYLGVQSSDQFVTLARSLIALPSNPAGRGRQPARGPVPRDTRTA